MHRFLHDARFYTVLQQIDRSEAGRYYGQACPHCDCAAL